MFSLDFRSLIATDLFSQIIRPANPRSIEKVAVVGAGTWGTALAVAMARAGKRVSLWGRNETQMTLMRRTRRNHRYLGDAIIPNLVSPTSDLKVTLEDADAVLIVVPSSAFRQTLTRCKEHITSGTPVISCTKGLDPDTNQLLTKTIAEELPDAEPMFLSGPSFAAEVAAGEPTQVVIAGDIARSQQLAESLSSPGFILQPEPDIIGAQIGGLMKNVIAIACGIADGLGHGSNTRAAILARGLQEASELAKSLGGDPTTLLGVAGAGDLALTCTDPQSRNYSFGRAIADPTKPVNARTFEGASSVEKVCALLLEYKLEGAISAAVCRVLHGELTPKAMISAIFFHDARDATSQMIAC